MASIAQWDVNNECNLNCKHCRVSERNDSDKLSLKEAKELLSELWYNGVTMLNLSGGEPFLRKDIFEILDYTKKFTDIVITSSGIFLIISPRSLAFITILPCCSISAEREERIPVFRS